MPLDPQSIKIAKASQLAELVRPQKPDFQESANCTHRLKDQVVGHTAEIVGSNADGE